MKASTRVVLETVKLSGVTVLLTLRPTDTTLLLLEPSRKFVPVITSEVAPNLEPALGDRSVAATTGAAEAEIGNNALEIRAATNHLANDFNDPSFTQKEYLALFIPKWNFSESTRLKNFLYVYVR